MNDSLIDAFDDCLRAMEAGATLDAALARYPRLAAELRPMLLAARIAQPAEPTRVPRQSEEASRARFMARARELRQTRRRSLAGWLAQISLAPRLAFAVLALGLGGFGVATASASSLPGDALYGLKRAAEQAQLSFTPAGARPALESEFEQRRAEEVQALLDRQREAQVDFTGVVEARNGAQWIIRGLRVEVSAELQLGIGLGDRVRVTGNTQVDGSLRATRLEKLGGDDTPTPPVAASMTAGATREPGETEQPEGTATSGPSPSNTPQPTGTSSSGPSPSNTPARTAPPTGTSGSGPSPSNTPRPTETPSAPSPSNTPDADDTDEPEEEEFEGTLQSTNPWTVNGQVFTVNAETEFRNNPQVGDNVEVKAYRLNDGTLLARRIEKK
jgi:hypothetical protein